MASPTFDNFAGVLMHAHAIGDVTGALAVTLATRDNILASTPTADKLAYATDTLEFFVFENGAWKAQPLPFGAVSTTPDIGALPYKEDYGYGIRDIASKVLHNIIFGDFEQGELLLSAGAVRYHDGYLQLYKNSAWLNVITLTDAQVRDWMLYSQWQARHTELAPSMDTVTKTVSTLGFVDIGAIPADVILDGGELI